MIILENKVIHCSKLKPVLFLDYKGLTLKKCLKKQLIVNHAPYQVNKKTLFKMHE